MAVKKQLYTEYELEFLETKAGELKRYIESKPFDSLVDRMSYKETKNGGVIPMVVATIEAQRKDLTSALKEYAEIIQVIDKMRADEEKKKEARGGQSVPYRMQ